MISNDIIKVQTIKDLITKGTENSLTLNNTNLYNRIDNLIIAVSNVFIKKYYDIIKYNSIRVSLTNKEFSPYKYRPKFLSYTLYKTIELWYLILWMNNILSSSEFIKPELFLLSVDKMNVINKIWNNEKLNLSNNKDDPDFFVRNEALYKR